MSNASELREVFDSGKIAADKIDRAAGVIRGVKILGVKSNNKPPFNHLYPLETRQKATPLLEGAKVGMNHPAPGTGSRPVQDTLGLGLFRNVHHDLDGSYADWHFNPKHQLAESIFWEAENNPNGLAFSINGDSQHKRPTDAGTIVESIDSLDYIDLVSRGATTNGLFEELRKPMKKKLSTLIEELKTPRPGYSRALREMAEAGIMSPDSSYDEPAPMGAACAAKGPPEMEAMDHETALKAGFKGAVNAVLDDDSMDMKAKLAKVKEILAAQEKLLGGGKGAKGGKGDDGDGDEDEAKKKAEEEKKAEESRRSQQGNLVEALQLQIKVRDLCADETVTPTKVLRKALDGCTTLQEARDLIVEHKKTLQESAAAKPAPAGGARSGTPATTPTKVQESQQTTPAAAADPDKARADRVAAKRRGG